MELIGALLSKLDMVLCWQWQYGSGSGSGSGSKSCCIKKSAPFLQKNTSKLSFSPFKIPFSPQNRPKTLFSPQNRPKITIFDPNSSQNPIFHLKIAIFS
jgi:hypothetical protein